MSRKIAWLSLVFVMIAGFVLVSSSLYRERVELREMRANELASIAALLKENQELLRALQAASPTIGILHSYLAAIRADGVAKHPDIKQRLDRLAENNASLLAIINLYAPWAKTAAFNAGAERFQYYAIAWRDRWNSVMELFMAGGDYPATEVPFPQAFAEVVQAEIEAVT